MATPTRHLCRTLFQISRRIPVKRKCQTPFLARQRVAVPFRQLSTTCLRRANDRQNVLFEADDDDDLEEPSPDSYRTPSSKPITTADLDASELADFNMLSPKDQVEYLALQNHYAAELEDATAEDAMDALVDTVDRQVSEEVEPLDFPDVPHRPGFWAEDEDDEFGQVEDDDDNPDDSGITSVAHSELDLHREVREYTRVIAWDMPLLQQFAKPFTPPNESTPLRFRYTTYMGEQHPAAHKVVVQFCVDDLPNLNDAQRTKFRKLVGPRYNPDTDVVKMSCEQFEAPAQNKRYLGDLVNKLLDESRNGKDQFEDVPLDLRHHKSKKAVEFPEEWKLKPQRVRDLMLTRQDQKLLGDGIVQQQQQQQQGEEVLDGKQLVNSYVRSLGRQPGPHGLPPRASM